MQVERTPSRWPYAVTLVYLLVLCLTVPRYWHAAKRPGSRAVRPGAAAGTQPLGQPKFVLPFSESAGRTGDAYSMRGDDIPDQPWTGIGLANPVSVPGSAILPAAGPPPTIDELLAALDALLGRASPDDDWRLDKPHSPPAAAHDPVVDTLKRVGRRIAGVSPHDLARLVPTVRPSSSGPRRSSAAADGAPSTIEVVEAPQLVHPHDRLAMVPRSNRRPPPIEPPKVAPKVAPKALSGPPPAAQAVPATPRFDWPWSSPVTLMEQLEVLARHAETGSWARNTAAQLQAFTANQHLRPYEAAVLIGRLRELSSHAAQLADNSNDEVLRAELLRAHWGLERRLDCWSPMREIASRSTAEHRIAARSSIGSLFTSLPGQAVEPIDVQSFSAELESYERTRTPRLAWAIRQAQRQLRLSADAEQVALADAVDDHYRNANLRIAVTGELLNRFVPQQDAEARSVHERIVGTPVHGRSLTHVENRVELLPDTGRLNLGWETDGTVASRTQTDGGPVVLHSRATTNFSAQKPILVESDGVRLGQTQSDANNRSRVVGVQSPFDWIPILGSYVRSRAMQQYRAKRSRAQAEVEWKVAERASRRLDEGTSRFVDDVERKVRDRVTEPLEEHGISLTPVELTTTDQRVVARVRFASDDQLGAHTPRPTAPSDSWASLQLHESALTNAAIALELDGKRLTAPELQRLMQEKFADLNPASDERPSQDVSEETIFQFADRDAVQFHVVDGRIRLTLVMVEFVHDGQATRNFNVHAFYRPEIDGIEAELVRDGALGIEGRLRAGERARLHNVFNEVFSEDRRLPVVRLDQPADSRLAGLVITQFVLEDGWLGLAIGPAASGRVAERSRSLR